MIYFIFFALGVLCSAIFLFSILEEEPSFVPFCCPKCGIKSVPSVLHYPKQEIICLNCSTSFEVIKDGNKYYRKAR